MSSCARAGTGRLIDMTSSFRRWCRDGFLWTSVLGAEWTPCPMKVAEMAIGVRRAGYAVQCSQNSFLFKIRPGSYPFSARVGGIMKTAIRHTVTTGVARSRGSAFDASPVAAPKPPASPVAPPTEFADVTQRDVVPRP